ncbi:DUF3563 family protein [Robbsia sp. Bb-Pol-6]|uniref:DUF3563 family protein n=1 Tax=Robbsia betulipollinis TaxID=2981849 RepID=A0ABT3ZN45_9BURK|nr:DUF3563 family protein [Robbsia betulipollinis]MCY0387832.1 DUF3563 family protein [Robbsia betulipollinis]
MKAAMKMFRSLSVFLSTSADARREARQANYLSQATDLHDLEFRIRQLDRQQARPAASWMSLQG